MRYVDRPGFDAPNTDEARRALIQSRRREAALDDRSDLISADLSQTQGDLSQTQSDLSQTQSDLSQAQSDLAQLQADLAQAQSDLTVLQNALINGQTGEALTKKSDDDFDTEWASVVPALPYAMAKSTSNGSYVNPSMSVILAVEAYVDPNGWVYSAGIRPTLPGTYMCIGSLQKTLSDYRMVVQLRKNGGTTIVKNDLQGVKPWRAITVSGLEYFNGAGDYLSLYVRHDSPAGQIEQFNNHKLEMFRINPS